jgi:ureidoglycolate lyase
MITTEAASYTIKLEPLAPETFADFGDVAARPTGMRRRYLPTAQDNAVDAKTLSLWISSAATVASLPLRLAKLERHPYSAQTFVPLDPGSYLVVVCGARADGRPDLDSLRAFVAGSHQTVTFARNVWHHPMTVLDRHMEFAVAMGMTGRDDDDVFCSLDVAVDVLAPPAL